MAIRMQQRRGTQAQWASTDPTLASGEIGFESDTGKFKIGNGSSPWTELSYFADSADFDTTSFVLNSQKGVANGVATLDATGNIPVSQLGKVIATAPALLDTLEELATAINSDPNFSVTINNALTAGLSAAASDLAGHNADTTGVHGIADTSLLATQAYVISSVSTHNATTNIHGIADTSVLATDADLAAHAIDTTNIHGIADTAQLATLADISSHSNDTTSVHGIADTAQLATLNDLSVHSADTTNVHGIVDTAQLATLNDLSVHSADTTNVHGIVDTAQLATLNDLSVHSTDTTNIHGIVDTAQLATLADITSHSNDTTSVHGIANTADLALKSYVDSSVSTHSDDTTSVHGISNTADLVYTNDARLSNTRTPTDNTVATAKIVDSAVTTAKINDLAVTTAKIDNGAVTSAKIADGTIATGDLADGAVTSAKIADGTIVNADINDSAAIAQSKISGLTSDLGLKAPLASPALTGTPTAPTATAGTNTTQIATTAFVQTAVDNLVASAPGALNTLDELAAALGDDANYAATVTTALAAKAPLASPTFTGTVTVSASGVAFTDGTQTKEGVPSKTAINPITASTNLSTLGLSARDSMIEANSTSQIDITIPADATTNFPIGTSIDVLRTNTGAVLIKAAAGVTINATPQNATDQAKLRERWSSATLFKRAANTWIVMGDLSA